MANNNSSSGRVWVCKTLRQLNFLIEKGYKPLYTLPDCNNPKFNVFVFNRDADGFEAALAEWKHNVDEYFRSKNN